MIEPWELIASEKLGDYRVFSVHEHQTRSPSTGQEHGFYVIDSQDWINVIPVTPDGRIVFIRQYRHGIAEVTLEVPGGIIDPSDPSPASAARRELVEETGYEADQLIELGAVDPNPAIQSNRCYTYLAQGVHKAGPQQLDGTEEIDIVLVDPDDVPSLIMKGSITHALVVSAFYFYDQHRRQPASENARSTAT